MSFSLAISNINVNLTEFHSTRVNLVSSNPKNLVIIKRLQRVLLHHKSKSPNINSNNPKMKALNKHIFLSESQTSLKLILS